PNCRAGWHDLGPEIDWRRGMIHEYGSSGWLVLHFWYWGLFAAAGYAITRDERYAREFELCWRRWQEDFPFHVDPDSIARGGSFSPEHSVMRAGRRILVLTDVLYSGLLSALDDDVAFEALKYVWFVSGHYLRHPRTPSGRFVYHCGNHNLFDVGVTPYCIGMAWPEFAHSPELVEQGRALVRRHIRSSIDSEGVSVEHSSRYAWYIANMYVQAVEIARLNGDDLLLASHERKLRRFLWTLVELTAPDGRLIPFGDCQPPPDSLQLHSYRALFADRVIEDRAAAYGVDLERGWAPCAVRLDDEPPGCIRRPHRHFRRSGMVLVRDGISRDASELWIIADPRGRAGHGHFDFTSFQLWCRGIPLVFDTAGFGYRIEVIDPDERAFYYSPFGHSLLTVDDITPVPMRTMRDVRRWWGNDVGDARIEEVRVRGTAGRVVCSHRSYPGMTVRRTYEFDLAERYVGIEDRVTFADADSGTHTCRQAFHLSFGLCPRVEGRRARIETDRLQASFIFDASVPFAVSSRHSSLAQRAATVFGFGEPHILFAEGIADGRACSFSCRIEWE
ncbi:MAG: heparinase II/III family protein, partial [Armatimonadetes bacterium]|nr:heparinase II/III family protein [Armatimonadota bacterium]